MIYFAVDEPRIHLLEQYLAGWGRPLRDHMRQISYPALFRSRALPRGAWIFTSLDALSDAELRMVHHIQCAARDAGLPVFNSAREALHRFDLLHMLHERGVNDFRVHRADGPLESVRFPVFVRIADEHDGSLTELLHDPAQLGIAMAYLRVRGLKRRQLLVVEFCETAGPDRLYRKYSIFRIGEAYIPRYLHAGAYWMTKDGTRAAEENLILEEQAYLRENPDAAWAREIFEMAHIDYGRLDYGVRNGRPQAWEINLTPVLGGNPNRGAETPEKQRVRMLTHPAKEYAHAQIRAAFLRIDPGWIPGDDIRVEFPSALAEKAQRERDSMYSLERRQRRIARIAAAPGIRAIGSVLRRALRGR